jgi:hypothetical protein
MASLFNVSLGLRLQVNDVHIREALEVPVAEMKSLPVLFCPRPADKTIQQVHAALLVIPERVARPFIPPAPLCPILNLNISGCRSERPHLVRCRHRQYRIRQVVPRDPHQPR